MSRRRVKKFDSSLGKVFWQCIFGLLISVGLTAFNIFSSLLLGLETRITIFIVLLCLFWFGYITLFENKYFKGKFLDKESWHAIFGIAFCIFITFTVNIASGFYRETEKDILKAELVQHQIHNDEIYNRALKAIDATTLGSEEQINRVNALTEQLKLQITDPARPGIGERAKELIKEIETVLGEKLTEFSQNTKPAALAERYEQNIHNIVARLLKSGDFKRATELKTAITAEHQRIDSLIAESIAEPQYRSVENIVKDINKLISTVKEFVNDSDKFDYPTVEFTSKDINGLGIIDKFKDYKWNIFIYGLLAFLIDSIPIGFAAFFMRDRKTEHVNNKEVYLSNDNQEKWPALNEL